MAIYPIISAEEAAALICDQGDHQSGADVPKADVIVFDASAHMPNAERDAEAEFLQSRLPHAIRFDINTIALPDADFPHTMPTAPLFQRHMQLMGVNTTSHILIYDDSAIFSSARAWFMCRYFGHENVQVIDGGLKAWKAAGGKIEKGEATPKKRGNFIANDPVHNDGLLSVHAMKKLVSKSIDDRQRHILDARSADRFYGRVAEPRHGLASGHMPGAMNIPFTDLIDQNTGKMKPVRDLEAVFSNVTADKAIVTTCGSGVTACALILGLAMIGRYDSALYDGSWTEWGGREDCPISV